jgi:sec-independent protein translocase protein TatA
MSFASPILFGFGFGGIGPMEMIIVGVVAVLLFGKRLPEVGRSLGKGLVEFKKGIRGIEDDLNTNTSSYSSTSRSSGRFSEIDDRDEATAPRFEPPTNEPQVPHETQGRVET